MLRFPGWKHLACTVVQEWAKFHRSRIVMWWRGHSFVLKSYGHLMLFYNWSFSWLPTSIAIYQKSALGNIKSPDSYKHFILNQLIDFFFSFSGMHSKLKALDNLWMVKAFNEYAFFSVLKSTRHSNLFLI